MIFQLKNFQNQIIRYEGLIEVNILIPVWRKEILLNCIKIKGDYVKAEQWLIGALKDIDQQTEDIYILRIKSDLGHIQFLRVS